MTNDERDILIRIDQKVTDMHDNCERHSKQINELYKKTELNSRNIAKIAGGVAAGVTIITILLTMIK